MILQPITLTSLCELLDGELQGEDLGQSIAGIQEDSRAIKEGEIFCATVGMQVDGHDYAQAAADKGATALIVERKLDVALPQILVRNSSRALGLAAAAIARHPSDTMKLVGITGTNGKTTTAYLVEAILEAAGQRPGILGTVAYRWGGEEHPAPYTTPTPRVLQDAFAQMHQADCKSAVLEVSSAALAMDRLVGTNFSVAAFSNLSQDHLDVHKSMEEYAAAKALLFSQHLRDGGCAVINIDAEGADTMLRAAGDAKCLRVSRNPDANAEIVVENFTSSIAGIFANLRTPRGKINIECEALIGHYNVDNIALAVGIAEALGIDHSAIADGLKSMSGVPGRVQRVDNEARLNIFVDYAHTPDALINLLKAIRPLCEGRVLCVFGCGGDRDPGKRPLMGEAVTQGADLAIVTSDNPRTEDPQAIIDMILPAVPAPFFVDVDRRTAIAAAVCEATPKDVVVIAGKGHEDYQILGTEKVHFDDREEARDAVSMRARFSLAEILDATGGTLQNKSERDTFSRMTIDGRNAAPGDLYFAIVGERFDGHDYCQQAIDAGAWGVVVESGRELKLGATTVIEVDDPREALGDLARLHRKKWDGKIIGITGSAGKTTTKDLVKAALKTSFCVHAAAGSNNNETGVPLTLLGLRSFHEVGIIEMGMRAMGEIDYLANIALPQVSVVINAGTAHIGRLGSTAAIARAKSEIFGDRIGEGIAIFPQSDSRLADMARVSTHRVSFGDATEDESCKADMLLTHYQAHVGGTSQVSYAYSEEEVEILLPLLGKHNAVNGACALLSAVSVGADFKQAARDLSKAKVASMRSEIRELAGRKLMLDCYNANPASMQAALESIADVRGEKRAVAILGDMLELGRRASECHHEAGKSAAELGIPVVAMGNFRKDLVAGAAGNGGVAWSTEDFEAAAITALRCTEEGDWILLKASRGMRLERVVDFLAQESGR